MFKRLGAIAVAAVSVVSVGCGGSTGQSVRVDATPAAMRQAAETTLAKGTSKVDFTINMTIEGHDVSMKGNGAMDRANQRFQMTFDAKQLFRELAGGSDLPPEAASLLDQPIDVILDGTVMFMHFPPLAALTGAGKEWIKIDLAAANENLGDLIGGGGGSALGSDPSSFLQFLEGAGKVTQVGEEDVRGVRTAHFSGSYTLNDALAALPSDQQEKAALAFKRLGLSSDAATEEIPFDAWIDADGLVRRIETSFDLAKLAPPGTSDQGSISERIEFFDFGQPVDIQLPNDDEVQDLSALTKNASTSSKFNSVSSTIGN